MKKYLSLIVLLVTSSNVHSYGSFIDAKITKIRIDGDGRAMIYFDKD